jgi:hypothetical protein
MFSETQVSMRHVGTIGDASQKAIAWFTAGVQMKLQLLPHAPQCSLEV